jgi:hypothetical protein
MRRCLALVTLAAICGLCRDAAAAHLETFLTGLTNPLFITNAGDGSHRLFIVEQPGIIKVLQPGSVTPTVFLDISDRVLFGGEQGLLGLAFHPEYSSNGRFFVNYTRKNDGATVVAEYGRSSDPNVALTTETVLLTIDQPFANHNGGCILFGHDGFLYIGMGDGGSANDPGNRSQNIDELLGKILRIDVDSAQPYAIPDGNPFKGATPGRDEIYAIGVRNPFRFSFDRNTGQLYVGDVGQAAREEIDIVSAGMNLGWRVFEGTLCTNLDPQQCSAAGFTPPIAEYGHTGGRCSVTGGYVYRGGAGALDNGTYVFGDFCSGEVFTLKNGVMNVLFDTTLSISSFGEDEDGEIYVVNLAGTIHKLVPGPRRQTGLERLPDLNHDGTADIVWRHSTPGTYAVWLMKNAALSSSFGFSVPTDWTLAGFGDVDGDGNDDMIWRSASTHAVAIWFMNGSSLIRTAVFGCAPGWDLVGIGDLNGDGRADLAFRAVKDGTLGIWLMNGGTILDWATFAVAPEWDLVGLGDVNGDGRMDLTWRSAAQNQLIVWFMNGLAHLSSGSFPAGPGWEVMGLGDLNGDGNADIVWRNRATAQAAVWLMNGSQVIASAVYSVGTSWSVAGIGDANGDGKADLLWHQPSTGQLVLWLFNGTSLIGGTVFTVPTVWQPIGTP